MQIVKYFVTSSIPLLAGTTGLKDHDYRKFGNLYLHKMMLEHSVLGAIQNIVGKALPDLNAPHTVLDPALVASMGVTAKDGDCVIQILRAWRNSNGETEAFDIS
jgi:hypothetical protein